MHCEGIYHHKAKVKWSHCAPIPESHKLLTTLRYKCLSPVIWQSTYICIVAGQSICKAYYFPNLNNIVFSYPWSWFMYIYMTQYRGKCVYLLYNKFMYFALYWSMWTNERNCIPLLFVLWGKNRKLEIWLLEIWFLNIGNLRCKKIHNRSFAFVKLHLHIRFTSSLYFCFHVIVLFHSIISHSVALQFIYL